MHAAKHQILWNICFSLLCSWSWNKFLAFSLWETISLIFGHIYSISTRSFFISSTSLVTKLRPFHFFMPPLKCRHGLQQPHHAFVRCNAIPVHGFISFQHSIWLMGYLCYTPCNTSAWLHYLPTQHMTNGIPLLHPLQYQCMASLPCSTAYG